MFTPLFLFLFFVTQYLLKNSVFEQDAELHLNRTINGDCKEDLNQTVLCQYIYTLGEASMTSPNVVSEELVSSLVALVDFYDERNGNFNLIIFITAIYLSGRLGFGILVTTAFAFVQYRE